MPVYYTHIYIECLQQKKRKFHSSRLFENLLSENYFSRSIRIGRAQIFTILAFGICYITTVFEVSAHCLIYIAVDIHLLQGKYANVCIMYLINKIDYDNEQRLL